MRDSLAKTIILVLLTSFAIGASAELPVEPIEIGMEPQFLFDNFLVDNSWVIKYKRASVQRVFHPPKEYEHNLSMAPPLSRERTGNVVRDSGNDPHRLR